MTPPPIARLDPGRTEVERSTAAAAIARAAAAVERADREGGLYSDEMRAAVSDLRALAARVLERLDETD